MSRATACAGATADGVVDGKVAKGFVHDSDVETFVALRAYIDNWRWSGVPFRLVTGKRMAVAHHRSRGVVQAGVALGVRASEQAARALQPPAHAPAAGGERSSSG